MQNSFKIKEAPEYFIHCLKESPTIENLQLLCKVVRSKPESWVRKLLDLDGLQTLFEVLANTTEVQAKERKDVYGNFI